MNTFEKIRTLWTATEIPALSAVVRPLRSSPRLATRAHRLSGLVVAALNASGIDAHSATSKVAALTPNRWIVEGALEHLSGDLVITFHVLDAETRQLRVSGQVRAPEGDSDNLAEQLADFVQRAHRRPARRSSSLRLSA